MEEDKGTVCVTGGTGFIASWLIMRLLEHGYYVRTTVRSNPEKKRDLSFLTHLPGASEKLQIFNADLSDPDSFEAAIEVCTSVLHVATPVDFEGREPEEVVNQRAINGTLGILQACLKSKTIKRVVYTSSASTIEFSGKNVDIVDENFWSDVDYIRISVPVLGSYMISKTLTEMAALQFAEEHGLDLVTLIPSFVVGPFICPKFPGSVHTSLAMVLVKKEEIKLLHYSPSNLRHQSPICGLQLVQTKDLMGYGRSEEVWKLRKLKIYDENLMGVWRLRKLKVILSEKKKSRKY
ncbi:hypothetical protein Ddye_018037 [Dipteronia dyeriana]|uniref:NAD-dependent epimerase/dehydratase domain-containing protein n=1 Tax=Dipteronia dyeriana TaxID=168575 RepID=A0AAD9UAC9_9ROSI|nr:hypothetical protein Ddye_018037 [Dipteronia dyeriana]